MSRCGIHEKETYMITLDDCRGLCDADPALVARVAREEGLPEMLALARAQQLCHGANETIPSRVRQRHAAGAFQRLAA